ncbi:DUF433 domain-containing protein [bacterium]|nr:DUF433 domain-containing protein [bacterium]
MTHKEILDAYPELEEADLKQAIHYAVWIAAEHHRPLENQLEPT